MSDEVFDPDAFLRTGMGNELNHAWYYMVKDLAHVICETLPSDQFGMDVVFTVSLVMQARHLASKQLSESGKQVPATREEWHDLMKPAMDETYDGLIKERQDIADGVEGGWW